MSFWGSCVLRWTGGTGCVVVTIGVGGSGTATTAHDTVITIQHCEEWIVSLKSHQNKRLIICYASKKLPNNLVL